MISDIYEKLIMIDKKTVSDGMGGFEEVFTEGAEFMGGIVFDNSTEARVAEKNGMLAIYTITVDSNVPIKYNDVIKRVSDGRYYKITSDPNDLVAPNISSLNIKQANLQVWTL